VVHKDFAALDLMTDILRPHRASDQTLVLDKKVANNAAAFVNAQVRRLRGRRDHGQDGQEPATVEAAHSMRCSTN
jgi:hypothetical protein